MLSVGSRTASKTAARPLLRVRATVRAGALVEELVDVRVQRGPCAARDVLDGAPRKGGRGLALAMERCERVAAVGVDEWEAQEALQLRLCARHCPPWRGGWLQDLGRERRVAGLNAGLLPRSHLVPCTLVALG